MPQPLLPDDLIGAIGRVAVNGSLLESDVVVMLWSTLGHAAPVKPHGVRGLAAIPNDFSRCVGDLRLVARTRLAGGLQNRFTAYLDDAKRAAGQRHRVVHGTWSAATTETGQHRCAGLKLNPLTGQPVLDWWTVEEVHQLADELHEVRGQLVPLLPLLVAAIPESGRTVLDGPPPRELAQWAPGVAWRDGPRGQREQRRR